MKLKEGWQMYIEIQHQKSKGFSNSRIARSLNISRPTVAKFAKMTPEQFQKFQESKLHRNKKPSVYNKEILLWLKEYPDMSAAQIFDWLEEKYKNLDFNESTLRNYVRNIRSEYNIPKCLEARQYESVIELPMGKQMQVDFGSITVPTGIDSEITMYVMCFVLAHSRYKYCEWQDRPFTTNDIIGIHENAFEFYGGATEEIVYDQDHLLLVSENHGDLIYTQAFAAYIKRRKFNIYMCRKQDPESKGKIENVVGYVKHNFASHRTFHNLNRWNEDCMNWLNRRGNGKVHATTRKIPAEVFLNEKQYLRPVTEKIKLNPIGLSITYQVRKDNTVPIKGNRYTVPKGTYKGPDTYVRVNQIENKYIVIMELEGGKEITRHKIPTTKGNLVSNSDHRRDKGDSINTMLNNIAEKFTDTTLAKEYLQKIRSEKPRYARDQFMLINSAIKNYCPQASEQALRYCIKNNLYSGVDFKDAAIHYSKSYTQVVSKAENTLTPLSEDAIVKIAVKPQIRDISEYSKIFK